MDQCSTGDDSTTNIPDAVKFSYLKSVLSKDVHSIALKILRERYANKQVLISSYMESFVKLQPITSMKNVSGLRAMYDLPYSDRFWRGENLAQVAQNGKNRQIKSVPNLIIFSLRQIKSMVKIFFL